MKQTNETLWVMLAFIFILACLTAYNIVLIEKMEEKIHILFMED